jgi:hypothetical protein
MFHYVEPTEENQQKKRVVKQLIKVNKVDRGLGLTKPESVKVDDLLRACEEIETQGAIVLKSLSQSLLRSSPITQEGINRFYVVIRKGLFALSRSTFVQTPRSDIDNLVDYRDNIYDIMVALNKSFQELNEEAYKLCYSKSGGTAEICARVKNLELFLSCYRSDSVDTFSKKN